MVYPVEQKTFVKSVGCHVCAVGTLNKKTVVPNIQMV
jgi:hypothetical protein